VAGEVLAAGQDAGGGEAAREGEAAPDHVVGIAAERAVADDRVGLVGVDVEHRREVDVDAERRQLAAEGAADLLGERLVVGRRVPECWLASWGWTTSTGAKSTSTPSAASARPRARPTSSASASSSGAGCAAWLSIGGQWVAGARTRCTTPPSWSIATRSGVSP